MSVMATSEERSIRLGRSALRIPRLGVGTMSWGDPSRLGRFDLGQMAYGPIRGIEEQRAAVDASISGSASFSRSPAQVALRWLIQQQDVVPIPGAKNGEQARHNAGALSFSLTSAEVEALERATVERRS